MFPRTFNLSSKGWSCFLLLLFLLPLATGQYKEPKLCNGVCQCFPLPSVVDCGRQDGVKGLPTNLPAGTKMLMIQEGDFPAPGRLNRRNLTGLTHLHKLKIINCGLRSIDPRTFLGMTNLRELDLSQNKLLRLESSTFYGLKLEKLYLQAQNNPQEQVGNQHVAPFLYGQPPDLGGGGRVEGLQLSDKVFEGLDANEIDLRNNKILEISYAIFSRVDELKRLILSDNRIRKVDAKFADYFDKSDRLLDLTQNPLICSCSLAWLTLRVKEWLAQMPTLNITCLVDDRRLGSIMPQDNYPRVELRDLSVNHLCQSSRIRSIGVEITPTGTEATLSCTAVAFNSLGGEKYLRSNSHALSRPVVFIRPPSVAWKYMEAGQQRQVSWMPSNDSPPSDPLATPSQANDTTTTVQLNVSLSKDDRQFVCTTWDDRNDEEVLVTIRGPGALSMLTKSSSSGFEEPPLRESNELVPFRQEKETNSQSSGDMAFAHSGPLFEKQYTLLELIGAVVGTFLCTLLLLLVGSRCMHIWRSAGLGFSVHGHHSTSPESKEVRLHNQRVVTSFHTGEPIKHPTDPNNNNNANGMANPNANHNNCSTYVSNNLHGTVTYDTTAATIPKSYPAHMNAYLNQGTVNAYQQFQSTAPLLGSHAYQHPISMPINSNAPLLPSTQIPQGMLAPSVFTYSQPSSFIPVPSDATDSAAASYVYDDPRPMDISQINDNMGCVNGHV